jgi:hypothetical protein
MRLFGRLSSAEQSLLLHLTNGRTEPSVDRSAPSAFAPQD